MNHENRRNFRFKTAHSSNYRGRLFSPAPTFRMSCILWGGPKRVIVNLGNLDFDIVSTVRCPVEDLDTCPEQGRRIRISCL